MPDLQIIPVVHSEGSGSTYQFTNYMATEYPSIWKTLSTTSGGVEYFPQGGAAATVRESGSDAVMNFLSSGSANGAIGYDEYSYPLGQGSPVAKLLNTAGYYTLPNQYNVAVALTKAQINTNKNSNKYLLETLNNVYTYNDPRVYPMSFVLLRDHPDVLDGPQDEHGQEPDHRRLPRLLRLPGTGRDGARWATRRCRSTWCRASFAQVAKLHAADSGVDISQAKVQDCDNPTFEAGHPSANYLAKVSRRSPRPCDKYGRPNCTDTGNTGQANPDQGGATTSKGGSTTTAGGVVTGTSSTGGSNTGGSNTGGSNTGGTNTGGTNTGGTNTGGTSTGDSNTGGTNTGGATTGGTTTGGTTTGGTHTDPVTGQQVANTSGTSTGGVAVDEATVLPRSQSVSTDIALAILAGSLLLALLIVPPVVAARLRRKGPA